jgi:glycosyltransferase involved in cell wall biosynthesis
MPVHNGVNYISEAVRSILNQTLSDIELIVVDNCSNDGTVEVLSTISDKRLQIIDENRKGVFYALNKGINECKGEFFARMDADDISMPERLEEQYDTWEMTKADVIGTGVLPFRTDRVIGDGFARYCEWLNSINTHEEIVGNIFIEDPIPSPTLFMPIASLKKVGCYAPEIYPDDYNLTLKNLMANYSFFKTKKTLLRWRDHDTRLSRTAPELKNQRFFEIKISYFFKTMYKHNRPLVIWGLGTNAKNLCRLFQKAGLPIAGFTADDQFIKEKTLYDLPICTHSNWKNCYFILATAAENARNNITTLLKAEGLQQIEDFIAFC